MRLRTVAGVLLGSVLLAGCTPEVGGRAVAREVPRCAGIAVADVATAFAARDVRVDDPLRGGAAQSYQSCRFTAGGAPLVFVVITRMPYLGQDGASRARAAVRSTDPAGRRAEPVPGLGTAASYRPGADGSSLLAARPANGLVIRVQAATRQAGSPAIRAALITLARLALAAG